MLNSPKQKEIWVDEFIIKDTCLIKNIPELEEVSQILKDLFEYPLLPNGTHVDKSKNISIEENMIKEFKKLDDEKKKMILGLTVGLNKQ